jgi:uncharacterized protein (TIGR02246 family)
MSAQPAQSRPTSSPDETDVSALYHQLLDSWNRRSAQEYAALFAEDGSIVGFDGSQVNGRSEIERHIDQIFTDHQTATYIGAIREVRPLSADVALLRAVVGMIPPGQVDLNPAANAIQSLIAARRDGAWRIELFQNTPAQFHGRPELVQQLTDELRQLLA